MSSAGKTKKVKTIHPKKIPTSATILKIDTEGCEVDILKNLNVDNYDLILLEYHSEEDRREIDKLLKNFMLLGCKTEILNRGLLKYINKK